MKAKRGFRANLPDGIHIGQRFLLRFDDPRVEASACQGRLQDLSKSGLLCFDAPVDVRPRRGTPVTVSSLQPRNGRPCAFSSEIRGRGRLHGRLPVLLVEPPEKLDHQHQRGAHRVSVCLRGRVSWREAPRCPIQRASVVVTNLSGGGAQVFLRQRPKCDYLELTIDAPEAFIEEAARRTLPRTGLSSRRTSISANPIAQGCDRIRERFSSVQARIAGCRLHTRDDRGSVYAVSVSFCEPQENCFQLVRFLERQSLRKCIADATPQRARHVRAGRRQPLVAAA